MPKFLKYKYPEDKNLSGGHIIKKDDVNLVFVNLPSKKDLKRFIVRYMNQNGRIICFHGRTDEQLELISNIAKELKPWQFGWTYQWDESCRGEFEARWCCIDEWIAKGKYRNA